MIWSLRHSKDGRDLAKRDYWRDDRDRILAWKRGTDSYYNGMENGRGNRYEYDAEGQLKKAWYRANNPETDNPDNPVRGDEFYYDELGNRKGWNHVASRGQWMVAQRRENRLNQYREWENNIPVPDPRHWGTGIFHDDSIPPPPPPPPPATPAPHPYVFPGNGVLMQDGWITAGFNALNQPTAMWSKLYAGSPIWMFFGYDPLGRCVKRWKGAGGAVWTPGYNPATYFYYDGWNLVQEGASNAALAERVYVHGGRVDEIVASNVSGIWYNHHYDAQGNCLLLSTASGGLAAQFDYDAFGYPYFYNATGGKGVALTRFLFTGREWINDMRLYDYRNRMYQPELGRFLQPDPKHFGAGDYNLYRYCHNDPINKIDPMGLRWAPMTQKDRKDYEKAKDHASKSAAGKRLFDRIEKSRTTFTLRTNNKHDDSYDPKTRTVNWDPKSAFRTNEGGTQSPALRLTHEIDHALTNPILQSFRVLLKDRAYDNAEERRVIRGSEAKIARDIGEAQRFDHHYYNDSQLYHVAEPGDR